MSVEDAGEGEPVTEDQTMAMSRREGEQQGTMWVTRDTIAKGPAHPFYVALNRLLAEAGFDRYVEGLCERFYAAGNGRPSVAPGVYFRMLLIGYFEGIDSERGIAWRVADSLGLREFLGYGVERATPDHSTLSVIRNRIDEATHQAVFDWILRVLKDRGLVKGKTIGIDGTTLEANAALRSIVRRDNGEGYREFLKRLAKESGIENPSPEDLVKLDRDREKKGSNQEWTNPHDPDAKITKMKDGRTHLAHKAEHAVDMDTGVTLAVTVQGADKGDTQTIGQTLCETIETLQEIGPGPEGPLVVKAVVNDKGYHSDQTITDLAEMGIRSYTSEPRRGRRRWKGREKEKRAVYANRRRIRGARGKELLRRRGERVERPFAHHYETGGMRRTHLKGHVKIRKRLLIHSAGQNLGLLMRVLTGIGKPRVMQGLGKGLERLLRAFLGVFALVATLVGCVWSLCATRAAAFRGRRRVVRYGGARGLSTGC